MLPHVVLLSDFGTADGYAAVMRGVILSFNPELTVHDAAHLIKPFSVSSAGYVLHTVVTAFPQGTVFACVVDPGVGTQRGAILGEMDGRVVIAPDNGTLTIPDALVPASRYHAVRPDLLAELRSLKPPYSSTFDGRDLFAPLAARVATHGIDAAAGAATAPIRISAHVPVVVDAVPPTPVTGTVIHIDRFGNAISSLHLRGAPVKGTVLVKDARLPIHATFAGN